MARRMAGIVGGIAVVLALVGCGVPSIPGAPRAVAVPVDAMMCADLLSGTPRAPAGVIPDGVEVEAVLRCSERVHGEAGDVEYVVERLEGDLEGFLRAIGEPDEAPWQEYCPAIMEITPDLWAVTSDGRFLDLTRPVNGCGQSKSSAVSDALDELEAVSERVIPLRADASWEAVNAGCPAWAAAMVFAPGDEEGSYDVPELADAADVGKMRLCFYEAVDTSDATFAGSRELRTPDARAAVAALAAAPAAAEPCASAATRLVIATPILNRNSLSPSFTVELDGCARAIGPDLQPRAAPAELIALLTPQ